MVRDVNQSRYLCPICQVDHSSRGDFEWHLVSVHHWLKQEAEDYITEEGSKRPMEAERERFRAEQISRLESANIVVSVSGVLLILSTAIGMFFVPWSLLAPQAASVLIILTVIWVLFVIGIMYSLLTGATIMRLTALQSP